MNNLNQLKQKLKAYRLSGIAQSLDLRISEATSVNNSDKLCTVIV